MLKSVSRAFEFYDIKRVVKKHSGDVENNAEHSWSLSFIFLALQNDLEEEFGDLDVEKILTMFSIHDLGELFTGDVPTWDKKEHDKDLEIVAAQKFFTDEMHRPDLFELFLEIEERKTIEAKIVKSIDRISPIILRVITGVGWHDLDNNSFATLESIHGRHIHRHEFSKTMMVLYNEIIEKALTEQLCVVE